MVELLSVQRGKKTKPNKNTPQNNNKHKPEKTQVHTILKYKIREKQSTGEIKCDTTHMHELCILTIKQMLYLGNCHIWKKCCMDP